VDPQVNYVEDLAVGYAQALEGLAGTCATDDACTELVGDLRDAIEETVERLEAQPEQVTVALPDGGTATRTYTPSRFLDDLFTLFYDPQGVQLLPAVVDRAHDGDLAPLANAVAPVEQQFEHIFSMGMNYSMGCTGESALVDTERALADVDDELIAEHWFPHFRLGERLSEFCDRWDVEQIYDPAQISLDAEVPTLVVTGEFDQVSLPRYGQQIHDSLPVSHLIEVPQAVHEPLEALFRDGSCGQNIVTDFLDDPDIAPDANCAADFALQLGNPLPARFG
jgi:pimeloyl-ACP methyl ester carboxylesterase